MCMPRQHPKRFEYQTSTRPPKWVNSILESEQRMASWHRHHQFVLPRGRNHDAIACVFGHRETGVIQVIMQTLDLLGQRNLEQPNFDLWVFLPALRQERW